MTVDLPAIGVQAGLSDDGVEPVAVLLHWSVVGVQEHPTTS
jgi:hypothetical protein